MKNKKADLTLSINAIVVLLLAITMLGLGLGFMRNLFSQTEALPLENTQENITYKIYEGEQCVAFRCNVYNDTDLKVQCFNVYDTSYKVDSCRVQVNFDGTWKRLK